MFDATDLSALDPKYFSIIFTDAFDVTIMSRNTGHYWFIHNPEYPTRLSGEDRKWDELSKLLQDNECMFTADGQREKLIIFTEHKDTLKSLLTLTNRAIQSKLRAQVRNFKKFSISEVVL